MKQTDRKGTGATPRRKFDETYKRHAVELTLHGDRTVKVVAKELGLPAWQLYEWRKIYAPRPGEGGPAPQTLEEAVKEKERYARIEAMKGEYSIRLLCELLSVAPSGYYRHRQQRPTREC